jgi:hypothetical protein
VANKGLRAAVASDGRKGGSGGKGVTGSGEWGDRTGWGQRVTRDVTTGDNRLSRVYCNAIRIGGEKAEKKEVRMLEVGV